MDPGERLAAYLVGELDADQREALEAELARDAALRERLAAIRRSDALLHDLPNVTPRAGFSERLRTAVDEELAERHGATVHELSSARQRRRAWLPGLAAAAAAIAALAVVGVTVGSLGRGGGAEISATGPQSQTMEAAGGAAAPGPLVLASDTSYSEDELKALAASDAFDPVVDQELSGPAADQLAEQYRTALDPPAADVAARAVAPEAEAEGGSGAASAAGSGSEAADTTQEGGSAPAAAEAPRMPPAPLEIRGDVSDEDLATVRRCLPPLLADANRPLIPAYAELATFQGEPVVVYGLVGQDPGADSYRRVEVWAVARDSCQTRFFTQQDR